MYLVEIILLIDFIVAKGAEINIATEKDRNKAATTAKKNNYNITIEENNKNNNKTGVAISANSELINLTKL